MAVSDPHPLDLLDRSFAAVGALIDQIPTDRWSAPTPCTDWNVHHVVSHLVGMNRVFAATLVGRPPPDRRDEPERGELPVAYRASATALLDAFGRAGVLDREFPGPLGTATGRERLQIRLYDLLAHGWDLAQAIGRPAGLPEDASATALAFARTQLRDPARPGRFGPAQVAPTNASALEQLVAFLGRPVAPVDNRPRTFAADDGTRLAYRRSGDAPPLVWVPGGPMRESAYLGDVGGLGSRHPTVLLDLRGTGDSDAPSDPTSYRFDRQVQDVESLRRHLRLDRVDLAAHSAGAAIAIGYAARHPERVDRLVLVAPSPRPVDVVVSDADRRHVAGLRRDEPWFAGAYAAFERVWAEAATDADWDAIAPFSHGRWDAAAQAVETGQNVAAATAYYGTGAIHAVAVRSALRHLDAPVLLLAGEYDVGLPPRRAAEYAALFGRAELVVQPRAGHFPWLDDPPSFTESVLRFLRG